MPRVLLIARYFPPIGGAGVHRTVGSMRHLPEHGYDPVLVTGPGQPRGRWDVQDLELLSRIPATAEVHRVGPEPAALTGTMARLARLRLSTEGWVRWWIDESARLAMRVAADAGVDVVLTSCAPYETALAGARVAAELGVPWVADLEDPWTLDEMRMHPTGLHRALDMRRMRGALASASAVIMAAPEAAVRLRRTMPELNGRVVTGIPIGFEREDFAGAEPPRSDDGVFRIIHTGSMHTDIGMRVRDTQLRRRLLGGTVRGFDPLTRSHVFLVQAIEAVLAADPSLRGRLELHLVGGLTPEDREVADRHAFVRTLGLLSHPETVATMRTADLLFLPMQDLPGGMRAGLIPYKTYEYLAARRPILAAVPDGDVRDMLAPLEHVSLVRPADVDGMAAVIRARIAGGRAPDAPDSIDSPPLDALERARCVAQIAAVLDGVLAG